MKTVAFDLDGTIVDVKFRQMFLLKAILKTFDVELDTEHCWKQKRVGVSNFEYLIQMNIRESLAKEISDCWINSVESIHWLNYDRVILEQIREIDLLNELGNRLILITARRNHYTMIHELDRLGILNKFVSVFSVSPFNVALEKSYLLRKHCVDLFIGDTESDFEAAQLSKTSFIGVSTGQRGKSYLTQKGVKNIDLRAVDFLRK